MEVLNLRSQLLKFLTSIRFLETVDDAILEYACEVLQNAVDEDENDNDALLHIDELLSGACGEQYEATALENRLHQLSAIVQEARQHVSPAHQPGLAVADSASKSQHSNGAAELVPRFGTLAVSSCGGGSSSSSDTGGTITDRENVSPVGEVAVACSSPAVVKELLELCSGAVSMGFMAHALDIRFHGNAEAAAAWLIDADGAELQFAEEEWRELCEREARAQVEARFLQERNKQQILQKFDLQAVGQLKDPKKGGKAGRTLEVWTGKPGQPSQQPKVRYLDGRVVSAKGEKFIVEKTSEEWDGGSRGKVYTKGKRGKGFA